MEACTDDCSPGKVCVGTDCSDAPLLSLNALSVWAPQLHKSMRYSGHGAGCGRNDMHSVVSQTCGMHTRTYAAPAQVIQCIENSRRSYEIRHVHVAPAAGGSWVTRRRPRCCAPVLFCSHRPPGGYGSRRAVWLLYRCDAPCGCCESSQFPGRWHVQADDSCGN